MPAPARIFAPLLAGLIDLWAFSTEAAALSPICSDRPGRGTGACTVEAGHWQVEMGVWDSAFQHRAGVTVDVTQAANPAVKYGLSDSADIEASMAFYQNIRVHGAPQSQTLSGIGDLFLHAKWNPRGNDDSGFAWILEPFLKLPTASHALGNGAVEGGFLIPISWELGGHWSMESAPELDYLLNQAGSGYHGAIIDVVGLNRDIGDGFNVGLEIWTDQNFDPAGTQSQYSFGPAIAWQPDLDDQLDGGFAAGLNRATPDLELYVGFSRRF